MCKMSNAVVLVVFVTVLAACVDAAGPRRKQVSTTLKMTAQRNDTGIWTAQFGDYEMVIEHRHFGKPTEGTKQQDGTWTMKLKHTVTLFPDDDDADKDEEEEEPDQILSPWDTFDVGKESQRPSWAEYDNNEIQPPSATGFRPVNMSQRKRVGKLDALSNVLREINSKKAEENAHSTTRQISAGGPLSLLLEELAGGESSTRNNSSNILPDDFNPLPPQIHSYEQDESEKGFPAERDTPEVSHGPRFEALRSHNPETDNEEDSSSEIITKNHRDNVAEPNQIASTRLRLHQESANSENDGLDGGGTVADLQQLKSATSNENTAQRMPTLPQRQTQDEIVERTVGIPQRHFQDNSEDQGSKVMKKAVSINQERISTDTQLEDPLNRGTPSGKHLSPWPTLTSAYENQQGPMNSEVAYDDVEAESAAVAEQEQDEDDAALAQEKKLIMERFPRSRSLPPYNMGYEHYPGVGWLKLNTSYWQWPDARKACEAEGAHLAVPDNERKVRIFLEIMGRHSFVVERAVLKNQAYVGIYTPDRYRRFTTVLGESYRPDFPIWFENEPNNADPGEECVTLHVMGRIRDVPCFYNLPFLCEIREH